MNKKVIAMAIAATMAAPMAAQAEDGLKVSGRAQLEATSGAGAVFSDNGQSRLEFNYGMGSIVAKVAFDMRAVGSVAGLGTNYRDYFIGMKVGEGKVMYGQVGGAVKNIEKDPFIATFLQLRGAAVRGGNFGSSGFVGSEKTAAVGNIIAYRGKMGDMKVNVDFGSGYMGLAAVGSNWYVGYNDQGTTKAGMNFGAVALGYDTDGTNAKIRVGYSAEMAGGKVDVTFATLGKDNTNSFYRVAYSTKMAGGKVHAGIAQNGVVLNGMQMGVGYMVKF